MTDLERWGFHHPVCRCDGAGMSWSEGDEAACSCGLAEAIERAKARESDRDAWKRRAEKIENNFNSSRVTCAYCLSSVEAPATREQLIWHVRECREHPMRHLEMILRHTKKLLTSIVEQDHYWGCRRGEECHCYISMAEQHLPEVTAALSAGKEKGDG